MPAAAQMLDAGSSLAHQVAAADGVDDSLATELADRAGREERRGARTLAARYLSWASTLRSDRPISEAHLLDAGRLLIADGQVSRAAELARPAGTLRGKPAAEAWYWECWHGSKARAPWPSDGCSKRPPGLDAGETDDPVAVAALTQLGAIYCAYGRATQAIEVGRLALSLGPADPESERAAWFALAVGEATAHGAGRAWLGWPNGCPNRLRRSPRPTRTCSSCGGRSAFTPAVSRPGSPICG